MPPTRARNTFCIVVDALSSRKWVKNVVDQVLVHNSWWQSNNDAFLYVLNYAEPSFPTKFDMDNDAILKQIDHLRAECAEKTDWLEGLCCATCLFEDINDKRVFTHQMILISDFVHMQSNGSERQLKHIIEAMNAQNVRLIVVIAGEITFGATAGGQFLWRNADVKALMDCIHIKHSNHALEQCVRMVRQVLGIMCTDDQVLDWISFLSNGIPSQNWNEKLTLGKLQFNTVTRKIIRCVGSVASGEMLKRPHYCVQASSNKVDEEDVIKGYNFLGKFLTLPEDVKAHFRPTGRRCFKIVGFIEKDKLPDVYFGGPDVYSVQAATPQAATAFNAFVEAVDASRTYVLVVRIYNNGNAPKLFVLAPHGNAFLMACLVRAVQQYVSHIHTAPVQPETEEKDESSRAEMRVLRQHLQNTKQLLHPSAEAGLFQKLTVDKLRQLVGYNKTEYESNVGAFLSNLRQVDATVVSALKNNFCDDNPADADN